MICIRVAMRLEMLRRIVLGWQSAFFVYMLPFSFFEGVAWLKNLLGLDLTR